MSWTPTFWILKKDFDRVKKKLIEVDEVWFYSFVIAKHDGVAIGTADSSRLHRELHDILKIADIQHWLIDGEGEGCNNCVTYGEKIDIDTIKGDYDG